MIKIKFSKNDKHYLCFKDYNAIVQFMRNQVLPWRDCYKKTNAMDYKKEVARRARIMYGENVLLRALSDKEFIYDLQRLGEIDEVIDTLDLVL